MSVASALKVLTDDAYAEREYDRVRFEEEPCPEFDTYPPSSEERWPSPEAWEVERERMYAEPDNNEAIFDRYA